MDDSSLSALERLALDESLTLSPPAVKTASARATATGRGDDAPDGTAVAPADDVDVVEARTWREKMARATEDDASDSFDDVSLGRWMFDGGAREVSEDEASTSAYGSDDEQGESNAKAVSRGGSNGANKLTPLREFDVLDGGGDDDGDGSVSSATRADEAIERARAFAAVAERRRLRMPSTVVPTIKVQFQQFVRDIIDDWLLKLDGVELPGVRTGANGEVSAHRVVIAVSKGVFLCDVLCAVLRTCGSSLAETLQRKIPSVSQSPLSRYPMRDAEAACAYVRLALRTLRRDEEFPEKWLDADVALAAGDPTAVWGILADIRARFMPGVVESTTVRDVENVGAEGHSPREEVARNLLYEDQDYADVIEGKSTLAIPPADLRDGQVREWLRSLRLQITRREETAPMLENPLRNGVLLSDVLTIVMGAPSLRRLERAPQNIHDAQGVIESALLRVRELPFSSARVPPRFLASSDGILNGDCEHIFGLLWCLRALSIAGQFEDIRATAHVSVQPTPTHRQRTVVHAQSLPYSPEHVALLQKSLAKWLCDIGVLSPRLASGNIGTLFASFLDGVVLCAVAEKLEGIRVVGVFKKPRTLATRESNVRKAVGRFLEVRNMSRRFLTRSEFDVEHITGILEDARACLDGIEPCRPHAPWIATCPYVPDEAGFEAPRVSVAQTARDASEKYASPPWRKPWHENAMTKSAQLKVTRRHDETKTQERQALHRSAPKSSPRKAKTMSPLDTNAAVGAPPTAEMHALAERIIDWLVAEKHWSPDEPRSCDDGFAVRLADVVSRGVILCRLASAIDHGEISGVERAPKTSAQRLHNITLALRALRANSRFPPAHLWSARAIARADVSTCVELIDDARAFLSKRRAR